jgi:hypothetical protein
MKYILRATLFFAVFGLFTSYTSAQIRWNAPSPPVAVKPGPLFGTNTIIIPTGLGVKRDIKSGLQIPESMRKAQLQAAEEYRIKKQRQDQYINILSGLPLTSSQPTFGPTIVPSISQQMKEQQLFNLRVDLIRRANQIAIEQKQKRDRKVRELARITQSSFQSPFADLAAPQSILPSFAPAAAPVFQASTKANAIPTLKVLDVLKNGSVVVTDGNQAFIVSLEDIEKFRQNTLKASTVRKQ